MRRESLSSVALASSHASGVRLAESKSARLEPGLRVGLRVPERRVALALTGDPPTESRADSSAIDSTLMGASSTSSFAAARAEGRRHERSMLRLELLDLELLITPSRLMAGAGAGREPSREVEASDLGSDLGDARGEGEGGDGGAVGVVFFSSDDASLSGMSSLRLMCFSTAIIASFSS